MCDACSLAKSHKLPFSQSTYKSTRPLALIHSDVWGLAPITSHFGYSYYVIFVDDYSKYTWLFPMKNKSDVFSIFCDFHVKAERQFSTKLQSLQSDWGGEYQALTTYLNNHGIIHRISCPYTPEQNGTSEIKHRHLIETALSLLQTASSPKKLWDEVVCTSTYLINRLISPQLAHKSPYETLFHRKHGYCFLKVFGCLCYPNLRPYASNKLSTRSERCVFLGYSSSHKGYRCLSIATGKLYISHDVIFNENTFPYSLHTLSELTKSTTASGPLEPSLLTPVIICPDLTYDNPTSPLYSSRSSNSTLTPSSQSHESTPPRPSQPTTPSTTNP